MNELNSLPYFVGTLRNNYPSVFVEGMSYEETLMKIQGALNEVIKSQNLTLENVNELENDFITLKKYIEDYFNNLDVQEEINEKINSMVNDGTFSELIKPFIKSSPLIVDSVDKMSDKERLYILRSTGEYYQWNGSNFVATGLNYNSAINSLTGFGTIITENFCNENSYTNLKDLPTNRFYAIGDKFGLILGLPENGYGTLLKISPTNDNNFCLYIFKNYKEFGGTLYYTIAYTNTVVNLEHWGSVPTKSELNEFFTQGNILNDNFMTENGYDNINKLPHNRVYLVYDSLDWEKYGLPTPGYATLLSFGYGANNNMAVYLYIDYKNVSSMYFCIVYHNTTLKKEYWRKVSTTAHPFTQITVGSGKQYEKLSDALYYISDNNIENANVIVYPGEYNQIDELGQGFFDSYTQSVYATNRGYPLTGNNNYIFMPGAIVKCEYLGENTNVKAYWSIFDVRGGCDINSGHFIGKNIRYCLHDDRNLTGITEKYNNSIFERTDDGTVIGIGFSVSSIMEYNNCIFKHLSPENKTVFYAHTSNYSNGTGLLRISNCRFFEGTVHLVDQGSPAGVSNVIASFNVFDSNNRIVKTGTGNTMTLYEYGTLKV